MHSGQINLADIFVDNLLVISVMLLSRDLGVCIYGLRPLTSWPSPTPDQEETNGCSLFTFLKKISPTAPQHFRY